MGNEKWLADILNLKNKKLSEMEKQTELLRDISCSLKHIVSALDKSNEKTDGNTNYEYLDLDNK